MSKATLRPTSCTLLVRRSLLVALTASLYVLKITQAAEPPWESHGTKSKEQPVRVIAVTDALLQKVAAGNVVLSQLFQKAKGTIGVPYRWGGTRLHQGIDCSNYIWQLYQSTGLPYDRFISTMALSRISRSHGLRRVSFSEAGTGDLLVYGYRDQRGKWHGHVVILVDKDGSKTGHKGLVLGAHGGHIGEVQFVTYTGFEDGFFKDPNMKLCNVLRVDGLIRRSGNVSSTSK